MGRRLLLYQTVDNNWEISIVVDHCLVLVVWPATRRRYNLARYEAAADCSFHLLASDSTQRILFIAVIWLLESSKIG
jgi:hypothetical protein